jgi:hypothetical protein
MQYTYTIFQNQGALTTRLDTTTRHDELTYDNVTGGRFIEATDNITMRVAKRIYTPDELDGWVVALERAAAWKPQPLVVESCVQKPVDTNKKTAAAIGKPKVSDVPPIAFYAMGAAMSDGAKKYGRFNWRATGVTASVFYDAMRRHLDDWYAGQDHATDSGIHHLAHMMAGGAIVLDAIAMNSLNDDRDNKGPLATASSNWMKPT